MTGTCLPIEHLTGEIQRYINNISEMYQVPRDMVTLAVFVATAVSSGKRITTNDGVYVNRLSLWGTTIGISGAGKSQYLNKVMEPISQRNESLVNETEKEKREWKGKGKEPESKNFKIHTITIEALCKKLSIQPDGVLLCRGEISGWVGSFGKYNKDDSEYATWIEIWDGQTFTVETKNGEEKFINVKEPTLSVIGGVQPPILKRFAKADLLGSGFLGRLLMVWPPLCYPSSAPTGNFDEKLLDFWKQFLDNNYKHSEQFSFSEDAIAIYEDFCYSYVREKVLAIGEESADPYNMCMLEFYGKIKIYAEKWAGLTMLLSGKSGFIDGVAMEKTIETMKAFEFYAMKAYRYIFGAPMDATSSKGEIIRKLHSEFGIENQALLASALGIGRSIISQYLSGRK